MSREQDTQIIARAGSHEFSRLAHADISDEEARLIGLGLLFEAGLDPAKWASSVVIRRVQVVTEPRQLHPIPTCVGCQHYRSDACGARRGRLIVFSDVNPRMQRPGWCPGFEAAPK